MMILNIIVTIQLVVSLYLTYKVWQIQGEIEDAQMVIGAILMDKSDKDFNLKDLL